jgi:hypothetical protein
MERTLSLVAGDIGSDSICVSSFSIASSTSRNSGWKNCAGQPVFWNNRLSFGPPPALPTRYASMTDTIQKKVSVSYGQSGRRNVVNGNTYLRRAFRSWKRRCAKPRPSLFAGAQCRLECEAVSTRTSVLRRVCLVSRTPRTRLYRGLTGTRRRRWRFFRWLNLLSPTRLASAAGSPGGRKANSLLCHHQSGRGGTHLGRVHPAVLSDITRKRRTGNASALCGTPNLVRPISRNARGKAPSLGPGSGQPQRWLRVLFLLEQ